MTEPEMKDRRIIRMRRLNLFIWDAQEAGRSIRSCQICSLGACDLALPEIERNVGETLDMTDKDACDASKTAGISGRGAHTYGEGRKSTVLQHADELDPATRVSTGVSW